MVTSLGGFRFTSKLAQFLSEEFLLIDAYVLIAEEDDTMFGYYMVTKTLAQLYPYYIQT
jgi:hypothetical protein